MGVQGLGAAIGNDGCPHNIVVASATVAMTGEQDQVLRRTLGVTVVYAALGGVIALALT